MQLHTWDAVRALPHPTSLYSFRSLALAIGVILPLSACAMQSYEAAPLTEEDFEQFTREHFVAPPDVDSSEPFDLTLAADLLRMRSPDLREALARYNAAVAVAGIDTPWPNPSLSLTPSFAFHSVAIPNQVVSGAGISFAIPFGDRIGLQDALHLAEAHAARADALTAFDESALQLRADFMRLAVHRIRDARYAELAEISNRLVTQAHELVDAGVATALDVSQFQLDAARVRSAVLTSRIGSMDAAYDLGLLLGMSPSLFGPILNESLALMPPSVPEIAELQDRVLEWNPKLIRMRAAYNVAERALHLEIGKQIPDFQLGGNYGGNVGDRSHVLGLTIGLPFPLFDQNQQAIARARGQRDLIRTQYESEVHRIWSMVEHAQSMVRLADEHHAILLESVLPAATTYADTARRSIQSGTADAWQLLDAERSLQSIEIDLIDAWLTRQMAWNSLERAVGAPLLEYPEQPQRTPVPPQLAEPVSKNKVDR